jgi:hypothetical protein
VFLVAGGLMKRLVFLPLVYLLIINPLGLGQSHPQPTSLIQVIASPDRFDSKPVVIRGFFLVAGRPRDVAGYFLFLNKEDAENNLGNSITVIPNDQMLRELEKIDRMYIQLTGTIRTVRIAGTDSYSSILRDVTNYTVWSDPKHPIGLRLLDEKHP